MGYADALTGGSVHWEGKHIKQEKYRMLATCTYEIRQILDACNIKNFIRLKLSDK